MPQKVLKFAGINRKVNEFQSNGACEELINLRPEVGGGHRIVKRKSVTASDVPYNAIYEHSFGDKYNQIAVTTSGSIVWVNSPRGEKTLTNNFSTGKVSFTSAGHVLVAYDAEQKKMLAYKFEDGEYSDFNAAFKTIPNIELEYEEGAANYSVTVEDDSIGAYRAALYKASSAFNHDYPNGICGSAVVSCAYELEDGTEVWSTAYIVADSGRVGPSLYTNDKKVMVYGKSKVTLKLTIPNFENTGVKKINVYATRPVYPYDIYEGTSSLGVKKLTLEEVNLGGQLMYYQGSVGVDKSTASLVLNFGTDQASGDVLKINAGCVERVGDTVSYNNRFHFYRSEVKHIIQYPTLSNIKADSTSELSAWIAFVEINNEWYRLNREYLFKKDAINDFIYPLSGVKRLAFVESDKDNGVPPEPYQNMFYVELRDSSAYNYSYAFDVTPNIVSANSFYEEVHKKTYVSRVFLKREANALNVSAPFNPFVFPINYSYGFGGEIKDIATTYLPISSTKTDQSPLTIFTSNGIFSLGQGSGSTLYGNIEPLQPQVIDGKAAATPYGTFFVSSKNLYMLVGRESVMVSEALEGEREISIREQEAYQKLCCSNKSILHNFSDALSGEDFDEFISDASMMYDQFKNELIISSNKAEIAYSYVLNLDTKAYHKVDKRYIGSQNGARYAIEVNGDTRNIVDMHTETGSDSQPILMQSRPFSIEAFHTHIQRMIMLLDTKLTGSQYLLISVFGSDNLHDWNCIISSQKHDTVLRQIRTNRAAKSYRDYIILINGVVGADTDLSEIITDYTNVSRRLG